MVDADRFLGRFGPVDDLRDRSAALEEGDERTLADLLLDQVEFATSSSSTRSTYVTDTELSRLEGVLRHLNTAARLEHAVRGVVDPRSILNTGLFDMQKAENSAGWIRDMNGLQTPESEEFGIRSFVYQAR